VEAVVEASRIEKGEPITVQAPSVWDDPAPWRDLFEGVAAGQREALASLYDLASTRMFGLALWQTGNVEDAADVVQEAFIRLAQEREGLRAVRDPRWWLLKLTHRLAIDVTRRVRTRSSEPIEAHPYLRAPDADQGEVLDARRVSALVAHLSPKQREVIYLHIFAGMSHAEIGRSLGIPTFTAASRYRLALASLRHLLLRKS
jgi:RNA polymerase sigma-70 factor (ECF subfamily)